MIAHGSVFAASLAVLGACCLAAAGDSAPAERPAKAKDAGTLRVAVLTGGHGYDKKKFPAAFAGHADLDVTILEGPKEGGGAPARLLEDPNAVPYDVLVLYNFRRKLSKPQRASFLELLDRGTGLVVLHHAIVAYPNWPQWEKIIGAKYYLAPTERDGVKYARSVWKHGVEIPVTVADPNHPITRGMKDFTITDETYGKWTWFPGSTVLLTTDHPRNEKQLAWAKTYRKARVVYIQLGHGPHAFSDENYRKIVARSIRWTAGRLGAARPARREKGT